MITFKKSYAEQILQLALAISFLQVNPDNYLGYGWNSYTTDLRNGDGWQMEILRTVPITEYSYSNRKQIIPLIDDLVRFNRQTNIYDDITAYLLNIQNHETSTIQQLQQNTTNTNNISNNNNNNSNNNSTTNNSTITTTTSSTTNSSITITTTSTTTSPTNNHELDLFLNVEHFQDSISIIDQNLADLDDYNDIPTTSTYFGLPFKEEESREINLLNLNIKEEQDILSTTTTTSSTTTPTTNDIETSSVNHLNSRNCDLRPCNTNNNDGGDGGDGGGDDDDNVDYKIEIKIEPKLELSNLSNYELSNSNLSDIPFSSLGLDEEESEIAEVLWKQDVDLGYSISSTKPSDIFEPASSSSSTAKDEAEKLKALEEIKNDKKSEDELPKDELDDEWAGIPFTIDNETGEYIRLPLQLDDILQEVLQLPDLIGDDQNQPEIDLKKPSTDLISSDLPTSDLSSTEQASVDDLPSTDLLTPLNSPLFDWEDAAELDDLDMMIQPASPFQHHRPGQNYGTSSVFRQTGFHHHHHYQQSRVPLSRGVSMEQRLQDIANLFNPIPGMGVGDMTSYPHYPTHPYQNAQAISQHSQFTHPPHPALHNTTLADLGVNQPHYGHNLASAVSSSMHLTNSNHEAEATAIAYKMEQDMMYYSNTSSELNHTTDGFINSILNDEDLQLMDMGVNENFCSMRMPDSNATSNNSSVLGAATDRSHHSNYLPMSTGNLPTLTHDRMGSTGDRLDASSDSAVSSMGSERVSSLSDGEWGDAGSDSAQDYHQGKCGGSGGIGGGGSSGGSHNIGPYDYSYSTRLNETGRQPVAQKKHQMFGKRYFQEQTNLPIIPSSASNLNQTSDLTASIKYEYEPFNGGMQTNQSLSSDGAINSSINKDHHMPLMTNSELKYACSLEFSTRPIRNSYDLIGHNHTYTLPQGTGSTPRPQIRDKKMKKAEDEYLTRDEKRARSLSIPITVQDIINLPMDEFNERLSKYDLSENQLSLIRDIRRRGKNKVAAQNCRKRKLDQILSLEDEVKEVRRRKDRLYHDRDMVVTECKRVANKFATLHRHVFQYLRDPDGNPCSPSQYSLQQTADGSIYLLRRENNKNDGNSRNHSGTQQGPSPPSSNSHKE